MPDTHWSVLYYGLVYYCPFILLLSSVCYIFVYCILPALPLYLFDNELCFGELGVCLRPTLMHAYVLEKDWRSLTYHWWQAVSLNSKYRI